MSVLVCLILFLTIIGFFPWSALTTAVAVWVAWEILRTAPARYRAEMKRKSNHG